MYQTTNQQKSTDEKRPLEVDHEEQQDKVQETTCQHAFFRRPPGGHPLLFRRNPSGTTHQVPNPEDGSAPGVLPANSTSSTAETRISAVLNSEGGSQRVIAPDTSTSSTTSTQSRLKIQTDIVAVTSEAPTTEDAEVNNSNVRTGQETLKVVITTPAAENATLDCSNVGPGGCPPVGITAPTIEDVADQNSNVKTEATPKTEDVAANNSNVGTQTLATENATLDSSNVETGVPASEEVVPNNPNMRRRHSRRVTDESSQNFEEANKKEQNSEDQTQADVQNCVSKSFDTEGSRDDITSMLIKMVEEKCLHENNARKTEEKEVKGKSQSASVKCWFCFCYAEG
ncbi:uncharacterized protein LOC113765758 isoform X2 [Coffea eugenioides]|uniref:uncharacterized protein LOC113765758 isoform X2 n=1 Tax=Coffea eugenioides TaxID=49369 RepID=UPI000F615C42|nr:uncharacterized protein LOC113765758 isoform X2 [Coffea eugenioides]